MTSNRFKQGRVGLAGLGLWACLLAGCASSTQQAEAVGPQAAQPGATPSTPTEAAPAQGEGGQFFTVDTPSGRDQKLSPRPKINAAAAQAYAQGLQAFRSGDLQGAQTQFQEAIRADSNAYQAHYSLGVVRERLGDPDGARSSYLKSLAIVRDFEPAIVAAGALMAAQGQADEAERFLRGYVAKMPRSAAVSAALAEVKSIQGDSGSAQRLAQEALKKNPDYRPAMVILARDHYRNRRLDLALYTLKGILDGFGPENPPRDKDNAEAIMLRGLIYKEQGNRAAALESLRRAVELRPDLAQARLHLAVALLEAGNADEAVGLLEMAGRYDPNNVYIRLNLGDAYRLRGRTEEARKQLEWVASQAPELGQVHYDLGLLYLFSESVPGMTPVQAAEKAIEEFETFQKVKSRADAPSDTDELITRAKSKKALLEAEQQAAQGSSAEAAPAAAETPPAQGAAGQ